MKEELSPGDLAIIIESVMGTMVGKIVQCRNIVGEHTLYGPVWRVTSNQILVSEYGATGNEVDVPAKWLKKIKPPTLTDKVKELEKVE